MGCGMSNTRIKPKQNNENQEEEKEVEDDIAPIGAFLKQVSTVDSIPCPSGIVPITCLEDFTYPVVLSNFKFQDDQCIGIQLPIIAVAVTELSRIMCFGHIQMFSAFLGSTKNSTKFFRQAIRYLNLDETYIP